MIHIFQDSNLGLHVVLPEEPLLLPTGLARGAAGPVLVLVRLVWNHEEGLTVRLHNRQTDRQSFRLHYGWDRTGQDRTKWVGLLLSLMHDV